MTMKATDSYNNMFIFIFILYSAFQSSQGRFTVQVSIT